MWRCGHQLAFSVLATGAGIIAFFSHERGDTPVAIGAGVAAVMFLLAVAGSVFAARGRRTSRRPR